MNIKMDFVSDLPKIAKDVLDSYGVKYSNIKDERELVEMFVNLQLKLIYPIPRKVIKSKKIKNFPFSDKIQNALANLEEKFLNGIDVNAHLSKKILEGKFTDYLLADWNIYHLHLNLGPLDEKGFIRRSDYILFLTIYKDVAYFVDVRPHGEEYVFAQKELLQIIADEWPWIIEVYRIKGINGIEKSFDDAKEIHQLRKAGVMIVHEVNGSVIAPMGGGITTAGTALNVTTETDKLYEMARYNMEVIKENRRAINDELSKKYKIFNPDLATFHLTLNSNGFFVYEGTTGALIRLNAQ